MIFRHRLSLSVLSLSLIATALVQPATGQSPAPPQPPASSQPSPSASIPKVQFEKYTLPNGLQVILHVDRKLPVVHVNQWFHVGSSNERLGRSGFAHLFEHMMFQGSKNASKEYFSLCRGGGRERAGRGRERDDRPAIAPTTSRPYRPAISRTLLWLESDRLADAARRADRRRSSPTSATWCGTNAARGSRTPRTAGGSSWWPRTCFPIAPSLRQRRDRHARGSRPPPRSTTCAISSGLTTRPTTCRW